MTKITQGYFMYKSLLIGFTVLLMSGCASKDKMAMEHKEKEYKIQMLLKNNGVGNTLYGKLIELNATVTPSLNKILEIDARFENKKKHDYIANGDSYIIRQARPTGMVKEVELGFEFRSTMSITDRTISIGKIKPISRNHSKLLLNMFTEKYIMEKIWYRDRKYSSMDAISRYKYHRDNRNDTVEIGLIRTQNNIFIYSNSSYSRIAPIVEKILHNMKPKSGENDEAGNIEIVMKLIKANEAKQLSVFLHKHTINLNQTYISMLNYNPYGIKNGITIEFSTTPLDKAINKNCSVELLQVLFENGATTDYLPVKQAKTATATHMYSEDDDALTILSRKMLKSNTVKRMEKFNLLVQHSADISKLSTEKKSALYYALKNAENTYLAQEDKSEKTIELLIKKTKESLTAKQIESILMLLNEQFVDSTKYKIAIATIKELYPLKEKGVDENGRTIQFYINNKVLLNELNIKNTNYNVVDNNGMDSLMYTLHTYKNSKKISSSVLKSILLQINNHNLNRQDNNGYTALMYSLMNPQMLDISMAIIKNGANVTLKNNIGESALDIEYKNKARLKIVSLLE